jgi:hypothetical protein
MLLGNCRLSLLLASLLTFAVAATVFSRRFTACCKSEVTLGGVR